MCFSITSRKRRNGPALAVTTFIAILFANPSICHEFPCLVPIAVSVAHESLNEMSKQEQTAPGARTYREVAAYHEAGHAVAALLLGIEVAEVRIDRYRPGNGTTLYRTGPSLWEGYRRPRSAAPSRLACALNRHQRVAVFCLAGPLAEAKLLGVSLRSLDATGDFEDIHSLMRGPDACQHGVVSPFAKPFFDTAVRRTRGMLGQPSIWRAVTEVARELLLWDRLSGGELAETVQWARAGGRQFGLLPCTDVGAQGTIGS